MKKKLYIILQQLIDNNGQFHLKNKIALQNVIYVMQYCKYNVNCFISEVVEHCCSITSLQLGETLTGIAKDMDTMTYRMPLGVTAGITPFNFPAMIPLWVSLTTSSKTQ